jgi:uncharacterized protein YdhG (YjbR/CyaY superfamily)
VPGWHSGDVDARWHKIPGAYGGRQRATTCLDARPDRRKEIDLATPTSVEDYLAALPEEPRAALEKVRLTIRAAAPEATESIAYGMPAFRDRGGRILVSYAAFTNHCSLFPASGVVIEALGDELRPYLAGKATIRFPAGRPIPAALVERIVKIRIEENAERTA